MCLLYVDSHLLDHTELCPRRKWSENILPVVLYGCETWSLALREEHEHEVFENAALGKIFGPK